MDQWDGIDPVRSRLRALVAHVEQALVGLAPAQGHTKQQLEQAWANLVSALALGDDPKVRPCPSCGRSILRVAVRCRYCMKFSPPEPARALE
jgi:hypothetical protein